MGSVSDAELAAKSSRWQARVMIRNIEKIRIGDGPKQVADKTVEFGIGDEMGGLLVAKSSAQNTGEAEQRRVATGQAGCSAVGADQFALDAKRRRLKRNEVNVFESSAVHRLAKHNYLSRLHPENNRRIKVNRDSGVRQ